MTDEEIPQQAEGEQASVELNEGLKTCQAVISNYRAMIAGALGETAPGASPTDEGETQPD